MFESCRCRKRSFGVGRVPLPPRTTPHGTLLNFCAHLPAPRCSPSLYPSNALTVGLVGRWLGEKSVLACTREGEGPFLRSSGWRACPLRRPSPNWPSLLPPQCSPSCQLSNAAPPSPIRRWTVSLWVKPFFIRPVKDAATIDACCVRRCAHARTPPRTRGGGRGRVGPQVGVGGRLSCPRKDLPVAFMRESGAGVGRIRTCAQATLGCQKILSRRPSTTT